MNPPIVFTAVTFLFATQNQPMRTDVPVTLDDTVRNVRASESLFNNVELLVRVTTEMAPEHKAHASEIELERGDEINRYVYQDGKFFMETKNDMRTFDGKVVKYRLRSGYDGVTSRSLTNDTFANIFNDPLVTLDQKEKPHVILFSQYNTESLADILSRTAISKPAVRKARAHTKKYRTSIEGFEDVDSQRTIKIKQLSWGVAGGEEHGILHYYWLAIDRNYIPIKCMSFRLALSKTLPNAEGRVVRWGELGPGIWYPAKSTVTVYDDNKPLIDKGLHPVAQRFTYEYEKVALAPHYDISLFRDIPIPKDAVIHEIKDGRIIKSTKKQ
jgi:hypothetical protein